MSKFDRVCPWADPFSEADTLNFKVLSSIEIQGKQKEKYKSKFENSCKKKYKCRFENSYKDKYRVNPGRFELENLKQCTKSARKRGYYGKNSIYVSGAGRPVCGDGKGLL